jgi:hypothetical protein
MVDDATGPAAPPAGEEQIQSHFIPFRKSDIIQMCLAEGALPASEHKSFQEFTTILSALYHHEYHDRLETLKDTYAPLSPDEAVNRIKEPTREERDAAEERFIAMLREVLTGANFKEIPREEINQSISADPNLGMRMEVDLDEYESVCVFRRDQGVERIKEKKLFGLIKRERDQKFFDRVVLYLRFKEEAPGEEPRRVTRGAMGKPNTPGQAYLKLFSRVPTNGLEMLFPNAKMGMRTIDKLLIGVPAAVSGIVMLMSKLLPMILAIIALIMFWAGLRKEGIDDSVLSRERLIGFALGLVAVVLFVNKQLKNVRNKRTKYLSALLENLYFRVFDNNAGVLHHLIGAAEDEDCKEALLAYYFLLTREKPMTEKELDELIEKWFETSHGAKLDFEVDDAARKLDKMELAKRDAEGRLTVTSLANSKKRIDWLWDNVFSYNQ